MQLDITGNFFPVLVEHVFLADIAFTNTQVSAFYARVHIGNLLARLGNAANQNFEPVVIRRVVAAGDHHTGAVAELISSEIQHAGWNCPDIHNITAGRRYAFDHALDKIRA